MFNLKALFIFITLFSISAHQYCKGQKKFTIEILVPDTLLSKNVSIEYDNGRTVSNPISLSADGRLILTDSFYALKTVVYIRIEDSVNEYSNAYFISDKPAKFIFQNIDTIQKKPVFKTVNADELSEIGERKYKDFTAKEDAVVSDFFKMNGKKLSQGDSLTVAASNEKILAVINKRLAFIDSNRNLYYSFWVFRKNIIGNLLLNPDSLLVFYQKTFPAEFQATEEGDQIVSFLFGRLISSKNKTLAPDFASADLTGKKVKLSEYRGKYVLLSFWATWCIPCIAEIPALHQIRQETKKEKLEIIAISFDDDIEILKKGIQLHNMNWVNIHNDEGIRKKYGISSLPMLFLIDDKGRVIYNRKTDENQFAELAVLRKMIDGLQLK